MPLVMTKDYVLVGIPDAIGGSRSVLGSLISCKILGMIDYLSETKLNILAIYSYL